MVRLVCHQGLQSADEKNLRHTLNSEKNAWIEMRSEDRESAGLQEGPAHVPKMERHT